MLKNYIKIAWRNMMKYKFTSFINLFGLTVGLTCCLLILAYIVNELKYDRFNDKADQIYRVTRIFNTVDGVENLHLGSVAPPIGPLMLNDFPDIKSMTRLLANGNTAVHYGEKLFSEDEVYYADGNLFNFFTVPVLKGNPQKALYDPRSVMLTDEMAKKYFGDADPIGKQIKIDNQFEYRVTGIYKPFPANAHLHPRILLSFSTLRDTAVYGEQQLKTNWGNNSFFTYFLFPKNYPAEKIEKQFPAFLDKHMPFKAAMPGAKPHNFTKLTLQKLTDIHLHSHLDDEIEANGDIKRVYIFGAIALFVLLIACINYMNLSTARSALRAKEIGIRKVVGAEKKEIILQFLSESVFLTLIALFFAIVLTCLFLPAISSLSGQQLEISGLFQWQILLGLFVFPVVIGMISGIYPALFMSSFIPIKVLKGSFKVAKSNISFREVLVVIQFAISIILIIATVVVFQQLRYMQNSALGYNKEHMVLLPYGQPMNGQYEALRNELLQNPDVKSTGRSSRIPTGRLLDEMGAQIMSGNSMQPINISLKCITADVDFIPDFGIQMAAGRNFSRSFGTDTAGFIINETAVKMLGWKSASNAIGKDISYGGVKGKIVGIMKDFHFESMHQKIVPLILRNPPLDQAFYHVLSIKLSGNNLPATISHIESIWRKYEPEIPFQYTFLDSKFEKLYETERQQGTIFIVFACIAIFIACLGLFGLSAFIIIQRFKEIGIRKVLGANVPQIVSMLSIDFLKLVLVAAFFAFPLAWLSMHSWLQDFAYRISIQWWVFVMAGLVAVLIAFFTVSFQSVKAAISNPVKSLRSE